MSESWIKLHRQFRETSFYGQAIPVALWVECLLRAGWEKKERYIGREKVELDAGEFVFGYHEMGLTVGCSGSTVKAWMDIFEKEGMVERRTNAKGTVCKLKKWSEYQEGRTQNECKKNADRMQKVSNKNIKNSRTNGNTDLDAVIPGNEIVARGATTPATYAQKFFSKDPDAWKSEGEYFISKGVPLEFARAEFIKFGNYWTELTPGGKKQRWETEKTFEVRRRLVTWFTFAFEKAQKKGGSLTMPDFRS